MKKLFYVLIFTNLLFTSSAVYAQTAAERACEQVLKVPQITIEASLGELKYDLSKNNRSLTRMHVKNYGGIVAPGKQVHGLASYDLATEVSFQLQKSKPSGRAVCVFPKYVNLKIGVQNPTIYISKNLPKESCVYQIAVRHEQTHQQINAEILEYFLPKIQERFREAVKQNMLISSSKDINLALAQEELKEKYFEALNPIIDEIKAAIKTEQAKLDSLENYDYEESLCRGR